MDRRFRCDPLPLVEPLPLLRILLSALPVRLLDAFVLFRDDDFRAVSHPLNRWNLEPPATPGSLLMLPDRLALLFDERAELA